MKEYYCPSCHRKEPYDNKYRMIICLRCQEEMFIVESNIKNVYKFDSKGDKK